MATDTVLALRVALLVACNVREKPCAPACFGARNRLDIKGSNGIAQRLAVTVQSWRQRRAGRAYGVERNVRANREMTSVGYYEISLSVISRRPAGAGPTAWHWRGPAGARDGGQTWRCPCESIPCPALYNRNISWRWPASRADTYAPRCSWQSGASAVASAKAVFYRLDGGGWKAGRHERIIVSLSYHGA